MGKIIYIRSAVMNNRQRSRRVDAGAQSREDELGEWY